LGYRNPRREFLHVDDLADAIVHLLESYDAEPIAKIGGGEDVTIAELARLVGAVSGFRGELSFDSSKPDGTPSKLFDTARLNALGWRSEYPLRAGIERTYVWFQ
jgi:GDP-L-fucose synthase